jgi:hypothetical protein
MSSNQLTLIHEGEFIICEEVVFTPPSTITATASLPINTMKSTSVRLDNEIVPLPFIRSQERKVVSQKIRIEGPIATKLAAAFDLAKPPVAPVSSPG